MHDECCNARPLDFTDTTDCLMNQDPHCHHGIRNMSCLPKSPPKGESAKSAKVPSAKSLSN